MRWAVAVSPSIALAALTAPCGAQAAQVARDSAAKHSALIGIIKDSLGMPVPYATVFVDSGPATIANDSGVFRLAQIPHGLTLFGVRRIGYSPLTFTINMPPDTTLSVSIRLHQVIARLSEVTVEEKRRSSSLARAGFYDRQQMGFGTFLSRIDVQLRAPTRFAQVLYGVLGVFVDNHNGRLTPLGRSPSGGFCPLSIFLEDMSFASAPARSSTCRRTKSRPSRSIRGRSRFRSSSRTSPIRAAGPSRSGRRSIRERLRLD